MLLGLSSCSGAKLRPDRVPPALQSHYDSIEGSGCEEPFYGTGICEVAPNSTLDQAKIQIQTYYSGTLVVDGCGYSFSSKYDAEGMTSIDKPEPIAKDCVLSFTESPNLPAEDKSPVQVYSLRGHYYLFTTPDHPTHYQFNQVPVSMGSPPTLHMPANKDATSRVILVGTGAGCDFRYDHTFIGDTINLNLGTITKGVLPTTCVYRGVVKDAGQIRGLVWVVNYYADAFSPVAQPALEWKSDKKLCVNADDNTSIIEVAGVSKVSNSACFDVARNSDFKIRTFTASMRTTIGSWDGESQEIVWQQ